MFGSSFAAAVYVSKIMKLPADKKVLIVGMRGIEEELTKHGIPWIGGTVELVLNLIYQLT